MGKRKPSPINAKRPRYSLRPRVASSGVRRKPNVTEIPILKLFDQRAQNKEYPLNTCVSRVDSAGCLVVRDYQHKTCTDSSIATNLHVGYLIFRSHTGDAFLVNSIVVRPESARCGEYTLRVLRVIHLVGASSDPKRTMPIADFTQYVTSYPTHVYALSHPRDDVLLGRNDRFSSFLIPQQESTRLDDAIAQMQAQPSVSVGGILYRT